MFWKKSGKKRKSYEICECGTKKRLYVGRASGKACLQAGASYDIKYTGDFLFQYA